jgi:hypothetical protein
MDPVIQLINTSVTDARNSLALGLQNNPLRTAHTALQLLLRLTGYEGHGQRRQLAASTLRKAAKAIADDDTPSTGGPSSADLYATLPAADLRNVLAARIENAPGAAVSEMLATLDDLRGEEGQQTRRKILLAAIGKAAKAIQRQEQEMPA